MELQKLVKIENALIAVGDKNLENEKTLLIDFKLIGAQGIVVLGENEKIIFTEGDTGIFAFPQQKNLFPNTVWRAEAFVKLVVHNSSPRCSDRENVNIQKKKNFLILFDSSTFHKNMFKFFVLRLPA